LADLGREVEAAARAGSDHLRPFANQLRDDLRRRDPTAGWEVSETASFRVLHKGQPELAVEVGRVAEAARRAISERWSGPPAANWSPRCDVYLHPAGADYAQATGKAASRAGRR
jgi:hypothetical protein